MSMVRSGEQVEDVEFDHDDRASYCVFEGKVWVRWEDYEDGDWTTPSGGSVQIGDVVGTLSRYDDDSGCPREEKRILSFDDCPPWLRERLERWVGDVHIEGGE